MNIKYLIVLLLLLSVSACTSVDESHEVSEEVSVVEENSAPFAGRYWTNSNDYYNADISIDIWDEAEDPDMDVFLITNEMELALLIVEHYDEAYNNLYYRSDRTIDINKVFLYTLALSPYEIWWEDYTYTQDNGEEYEETLFVYEYDAYHEVNQAIDEITMPYLSSFYPIEHQIEYVYEELINQVSYDDNAVNDEERTSNSFDAYGALIEHKAVCHGYALAYLGALKDIHVPTILITSDIDDHAWNMVYYEGEWTFFDVTYEDSDDIDDGYYYYYALNKEELELDHSFDKRSDSTLSYDEYMELAEFIFDVE